MKESQPNNALARWRRHQRILQRRNDGLAGPVCHVVILDGTMSSLAKGYESNAGITYKLLRELTPSRAMSLYYEPGIQWQGVLRAGPIIRGIGINRQIRRAYGYLAARYRPGDRIYLMGFSRGAFAVRSLAGVIDRVGLLTAQATTERNIRLVYRHYETDPHSAAAKRFAARCCHCDVQVEMIGVWDTVKALGLRWPVVWRLFQHWHDFHSHHLGYSVKNGFHALARDETRMAFAPELWECPPGWPGHVEQVWFPGTHGDVGGQLTGVLAARPLANVPLVWMLDHAARCGLPLPDGWRGRFDLDTSAPSVGLYRGWGMLFWHRKRRAVLRDVSERLHPSAQFRCLRRRWGR
jgi:uncharacterized protein (DUF2235 family)